LTLSYVGTAYAGWQRQTNALAIQEVVENAIAEVLQERVVLHGAGRTDAGVHARGQVAHLELDREVELSALVRGTNHHLPKDVRVMAADRVAEEFHARKSAQAKEYHYRLSRAAVISPLDAPYLVGTQGDLDLSLMRKATGELVGEHDFTAFALAGGGHRQPRRRVYAASWHEDGRKIELRIVGAGFLRGMVRSLVGTLLEVGRRERSVENWRRLLAGAPRSAAGPTAPAHGLVLMRVLYTPGWPGADGP
jgi:tRNA pseudouridine38-40 synthase